MATVATSTVEEIGAPPVVGMRNAAFDRARTFIILLVVLHHAVIPYTYYGHTDRDSFLGFDLVVTFNDSFFMAAMFLLSGLFVWPSLRRKGINDFLRGRWLRLGLPFTVGAVILMPIAYYAIELNNSAQSLGFAAYWWKTVTIGPWESGPIWFLGVLLAFDMLAAVIYAIVPDAAEAIGRVANAKLERPAYAFWLFLAASIAVYVPLDHHFGIARWFTLGPFAVQDDRILLYLLYFLVGVGIGSVHGDRCLLSRNSELARQWALWLVATIVTFAGLMGLIFYKREFLPDPNDPPQWWDNVHALFFASFSASQTFYLLAFFLKFDNSGGSILDSLRESSFGIFLVHYVPLLWLQHALFGVALVPVMQVSAILKALIVFGLTLAISWAVAAALRRLPGVTHVL